MSSEKRGPGRPSLPEREKRTKQISALVTNDEYKDIDKVAGDRSISDWLREVALEAAKKHFRKIKKQR